MKNKTRLVAVLMVAVCCLTAFSVTAFAANDGYYASDEANEQTPPDVIETINISTETVKNPTGNGSNTGIAWDVNATEIGDLSDIFSGLLSMLGNGSPLTPGGNLTLIDDILQDESYYVQDEKVVKDKQFITVQSKNGNYFYIIIDRSGDSENVYFLNLVDEADLMALMEDDNGSKKPDTCSCAAHCEAGAVDMNCPICKADLSKCAGKTIVKPDESEKEKPSETDPKPAEAEKKSSGVGLIVILILAVAGGVAVYWFKFRKKKPDTKGSSDLDDYDFGDEEDDDYEVEDEAEDNGDEDEGE